ncbi:MAG: MerR family transcriptional regulator [Dehalococcoidia bacterium]|nr:MerR family transcriptional regulator [Dehalococcoidia bacterium]
MDAIEAQGLYIISVAARLLAMHPQTLRKYERAGFITPGRTGGMLRLYSSTDIARLRLIKHLVEELGLNLAGVQLALELTHGLEALRESALNADGRELRHRLVEEVDAILTYMAGGS